MSQESNDRHKTFRETIGHQISSLPIIDPANFTAKDLPRNGIALFFEQSEQSRVVYVDTHKAEAGLYTRLRKHFGTRNSSRACAARLICALPSAARYLSAIRTLASRIGPIARANACRISRQW